MVSPSLNTSSSRDPSLANYVLDTLGASTITLGSECRRNGDFNTRLFLSQYRRRYL